MTQFRLLLTTIPIGILALFGVNAIATEASPRRAVLDRFAERFSSEIFPLLERRENGCKTCHSSATPRMFQVMDSSKATFSLVLERDLLNQRDPMFILQRLTAKDPDLHMPKGGAWTAAEILRLRQFATDLQSALDHVADGGAQADERFPDSLSLPFDGPSKRESAVRLLNYYQLRKSLATIFGNAWLLASGRDPFENKAQALGGADFKTSFEISRTPSASYLNALQEIVREVARRYVSAPPDALFPGFDPNLVAAQANQRAARNVRALYQRILFRDPSAEEQRQALQMVLRVQKQAVKERQVRFTLRVRDEDGLEDSAIAEASLQASRASVSRYLMDQSKPAPEANGWVRVGEHPFRFEKDNPEHLIRIVDVTGNHTTAFDALKLVPVESGKETGSAILIDNSDAECTTFGDWRAIPKNGEIGLGGKLRKKYDQPLNVIGPNHLESRNLRNELRYVNVTLRLDRDGEYNIYQSWPAIPDAARAVMVEVHSATKPDGAFPIVTARPQASGFTSLLMDQTESTLSESSESQWQIITRRAYFGADGDYVEINNRGIDPAKYIIVADAVRFESLEGGPDVIVDNAEKDGFDAAEGWKPDQISPNAKGRGVMYGKDLLSYPPAKDGRLNKDNKDQKSDPKKEVWARFRPVREGQYRPGWYRVHIWFTGGFTHHDRVPVEIHATKFAPVVEIERTPVLRTGEMVRLNAGASFHPKGRKLEYRWTHDASDLDLRMEAAGTASPGFRVPELQRGRAGWAALIEALLQHPEFLMPRGGPGASPRQKLVRVALDLAGRVPTQEEASRVEKSGRLHSQVDAYLESDDFRDFFFHRTRAALMSRGTEESDEPARLWTWLATHDVSYRELLTANYSIDGTWRKTRRPAEAGNTGILTMKGYLSGKPGLPHFTYPAQVLTFSLGVAFEVSDAVANARKGVVSTTDPASICYSCHKLLTPLAMQRQRWDDEGKYRTVDSKGMAIDDSDQNVIPDYPFKGSGLEAFAGQVVRKERFARTFINTHYDMLFHRQLRVLEDERLKYKTLYEFTLANGLKIRPLLKKMILIENGEEVVDERRTLAGRTR